MVLSRNQAMSCHRQDWTVVYLFNGKIEVPTTIATAKAG
jgi:hypothetical protein